MRLIKLLLLGLLCLPVLAQAMNAIFYQPQLRDLSIAAASWPRIFATARQSGFDTLVMQWTRQGDAFTAPEQQAWLTTRLNEAHAAGLKLVIGLSSDPDFFIKQQQPARLLDSYFNGIARTDAKLAQYWIKQLGTDAISGWYLGSEIDDVRWREPDSRSQLQNWLNRSQKLLHAQGDKPVYVSSFFAGNMAPTQYAAMLEQLGHGSGVHIWVQDGAGTAKLNEAERGLYVGAVTHCDGPAAQGIVFELFRQTGTDDNFTAERRTEEEAGHLLRQRAACGGDSVFFSLRYLPGLEGLLPI